jgi:hypothetical protein
LWEILLPSHYQSPCPKKTVGWLFCSLHLRWPGRRLDPIWLYEPHTLFNVSNAADPLLRFSRVLMLM